MLPLKTRPGSSIWMSWFLFSLGTRIEIFMSCQLLIIYLDGQPPARFLLVTFSLWFHASRAEPCLELREEISRSHHILKYLKILLSPNNSHFSCGQIFSFSVPGNVAWWHRVLFGNSSFRYCYFTSHHHSLLCFLFPPQLIPAPLTLHVTTVLIISQYFASRIVPLVTVEIMKQYKNNKKSCVGFVCFSVGSYTTRFIK